MHLSGEKVGEPSKALAAQLSAMQAQQEDTSCGFAEEGQDSAELAATAKGGVDTAHLDDDGPIEV